jgi:STE24 endopeptidase
MRNVKQNIAQVPSAFANSITLEQHQKAANYTLAKLSLNKLNLICSALLTFVFSFGGGINYLQSYMQYLSSSALINGLALIVVFGIINGLVNLPFSYYQTFCIEQKFGFNNTTIKLFVSDLVKGLLISLIIAIPLVYLVLWLLNHLGSLWWLYAWVVLVGFNLLILLVYPTFIAPLFNKFLPLADTELQTKINNLLNDCGFKANGIYVMDGSKRSSHGNAYFTGLGASKRIVFFDTLLKQLNHDEIIAVLAHELGHFKHKHILQQMISSFILTFVSLYLGSILLQQDWFYTSLQVNQINYASGLILLSFVLGSISLPLAPLSSFMSRKNEFEADNFAKHHTDRQHLINGLIKLYRDNANTLTPDPLYVKFYYSHPPATERIANLERN